MNNQKNPYTTYEIFGMTRHRNSSTIRQFLTLYGDDGHPDEQGQYKLLTKERTPPGEREQWKTVTLDGMDAVIDAGLNQKSIFNMVLSARREDILRASVCFCEDDNLVLGVSMRSGIDLDTLKQELSVILNEFSCHLGLIAAEQFPPLSERDAWDISTKPWSLYFWEDKSKSRMP